MSTTLYRFYDDWGQLLYVGIAGNPGRRFDQHAKGPDGKPWWGQVVRSTMEHFDTREAAAAAEVAAILSEHPLHNVVHNRAPGTPLPRPAGNPGLRSFERPPHITTADLHDLMAAINAIASDPGTGFEDQEGLADWLAMCGRVVPYGDYCEVCADAPGSGDPTRFPMAWKLEGKGLLAAYGCPRCGFRWHCSWALDAPWLVGGTL